MELYQTAKDYDNLSVLIDKLKNDLDAVHTKLERSNLFFSERTQLEKDAKSLAKLISICLKKMETIIEEIPLTEVYEVLNASSHG